MKFWPQSRRAAFFEILAQIERILDRRHLAFPASDLLPNYVERKRLILLLEFTDPRNGRPQRL
jgi:hypothetical protein